MSRAENAVERLYESADVRDELTDDEAETLLKWAEDELVRLDESGADDETFDAKVITLMDLLKQMNRYAGKQGQFSAQADDRTPTEIASLAGSLGHETDADQIAAAGTGDPTSTIQKLTELMGGQAAAAEAAAPDEAFVAESAAAPAESPVAPPTPPTLPTAQPQPPNAVRPHLPRPPSISADPDPAGDTSE
ncbi:MAG: hypothetical protein GC204_09845 [Chloroflexi bacterium]|nr:hypothetical protein [Chloroflexota bacterium]